LAVLSKRLQSVETQEEAWSDDDETTNQKETKTEEKVEIKSETAPSSGEPAVEAAVETS